MNTLIGFLGAIAIAVGTVPLHHPTTERASSPPSSPCTADSSFQRLAFWIGNWEVYDSTGKRYATQRVHSAVDDCAVTAEWVGPVGDKGLSISAYDVRTHDWKQIYVSNQVPSPLGIQLRKSDSTYDGPGVRFIPLLDAPAGNLNRSRVTIMPLSGNRAQQVFENSSDGGKTWRMLFKAEHRLQP